MLCSDKMIDRLNPDLEIENGVECAEECTECTECTEDYEGSTDKCTECTDYEPLRYDMDYLTPSMMEEARTVLKETEENKRKGLEDIRQLIKKDEKLVCPMDDNYLLAYLRARKFSVKRSFKLLQNYWKFRKEHRDILDTSDPESVKKIILKDYFGFLPYRDKIGSVVMIYKVGNWNPDIDVYEEIFRAITAILIHSIQYPATQVAGYRMIFDARGLSWQQLKMCTPSNILLLIHSTQYCFPARYRGIHLLSENKLFNLAWAVVYPLLTSKLRKRVRLHGTNLDALQDYIHPSVLPDEYGGYGGPFENSKWNDILESGSNQVMNMLNYGYKD